MGYIKKEPIIEFITKGLNNPDKTKAFGHDAIEILTEIEYTPTADVVEVKHGEWKRIECGTICTNCNRVYDNDFEFSYKQIKEYFKRCPECGAKMDGGKAE